MVPTCRQKCSVQQLPHLVFLQQMVMKLRRACIVGEGACRLEHGGNLRNSGKAVNREQRQPLVSGRSMQCQRSHCYW